MLTKERVRSRAVRIRLFDPNRLLAVIVVLFWPLRYFPIILVPAVLLAGLTAFKHRSDITTDLRVLLGEISFVGHLLLGLLIINLSARLCMGAVIRAQGGEVRDFGVGFFLGFVPRFYVDRSSIPRLNRHGQLWSFGAPLLVRLSYFAFGMLAWATYRSGGGRLADFALLVSQVGLWACVFAMMPLLPGDGYNWLATYFRRPLLRQKALAVLNAKLRGRPLPPHIPSGEVSMLLFFAVSSILVLVILACFLLIVWGTVLTRNLQGLGALIFIVVAVSFALWLLRFKARIWDRDAQARDLRLLHSASLRGTPAPRKSSHSLKRRVIICAGVCSVLAAMMFLPSSYDPAGPFKILPTERSTAVAEVDGSVADVAVREGDWVAAGQVLGHLSSADQQREVALARKNLEEAEGRLALVEGRQSSFDKTDGRSMRHSGDAERELARNEVERLRQQLNFAETQLERTTVRAPTAGFVTTPHPQLLTGVWLNTGDKFLQIDNSKVVEATIDIPQTDVDLVKTGAKVRLRPWSETNREIVGRVTAVAAAAVERGDDGTVRSKRPRGNRAGLWRAAMIEQRRTEGTVEVRDDRGVKRTKALSAEEDMARGGEIETSPAARTPDKVGSGGFLRVTAALSDVGAGLRGGMTGYAKISGPEMTMGEAWLRLGERFLTVELWSWVP